MMDFFPRMAPWALITYNMTAELPSGTFYLFSDVRVARTSKPTEFELSTDSNTPVNITINDQFIGTIIPKTTVQPVYINLFEPPAINYLTADNGVDEPVHLAIAATYMNTWLEFGARELYSYAGKTVEKYYNLLTSRWSSFIAEYQLPWQQHLPTVRSMRIMAVKSMALSLFADAGTEGGVTEFLSGFASSTPVFEETRNPLEWQPDLYQPIPSSDDVYGFDAHVWLPNLCVGRWVAFSKIVNNVDNNLDLLMHGEDVVTVTPNDTDDTATHEFNTLGEGCSIQALLEFLGCMDNVVVAGAMLFKADVPICSWATPFDQIVEHPGIGSTHFFDSGDTLDTEPIPLPPDPPFDSIYDIDLLTEYWVGTSTKKMFDFSRCLDTYPSMGKPEEDTNCCMNGPDTVKWTTMALSDTVTSANTPNHPIFGGDTPGLLDNPYFDELV